MPSPSSTRPRVPRVARRDGYTVLFGGPTPPGTDGITLGRFIIVRRRAAESEQLLAHELVHVRQYAELGRARFLVRYVRSYLRLRASGHGHLAAYRRIPLEVEASWLSRRHSLAELEPGAEPIAEPVATVRVPGLLPHEVVAQSAEAVLAGARERQVAHRRSSSRAALSRT